MAACDFAPSPIDTTPGRGDGILHLQLGMMVVDPATDTPYILAGADGTFRRTIQALSPEDSAPALVADVSGLDDVQLAFAPAGIVVIGDGAGGGEIRLIERGSHVELRRIPFEHLAEVSGSPSGRWLLIGQRALVEAATLRVIEVPETAGGVTLRWANTTDHLVGVVTGSISPVDQDGLDLLSWSMDELVTSDFPATPDLLWANPTLSITVPNVGLQFGWDFSNPAISRDDRWIALAMHGPGPTEAEPSYRLLLVEMATGITRELDGEPIGAVEFTPDGDTMVGRGPLESFTVIDVATFAVRRLSVHIDRLAYALVMPDGAHLVLSRVIGSEGPPIEIYDLAASAQVSIASPPSVLGEFAAREGTGEIWLPDDGLRRIDYVRGETETFDSTATDGMPVEHLTVLPIRDLIATSNTAADKVVFFDPATRAALHTIAFPL